MTPKNPKENAMSRDACATCLYCAFSPLLTNGRVVRIYFECCKRSPEMVGDDSDGFWPGVKGHRWCGDFRPDPLFDSPPEQQEPQPRWEHPDGHFYTVKPFARAFVIWWDSGDTHHVSDHFRHDVSYSTEGKANTALDDSLQYHGTGWKRCQIEEATEVQNAPE